jgi:hypothetical protein
VAGLPLSAFAGVDLVLPAREFANTPITRVHTMGARAREASGHPLVGHPLLSALPQTLPISI